LNKHVAILDAIEAAELVAVCDLDGERVRQVSAAYDVSGYTDVDTMLDRRALDAVHVTTPVQTHVPVTRTVVGHDVAVLIEKPVTTSMAEFEELVELSDRHDRSVSVVHNQLFYPCSREALARVERGEIGDVTAVTMLFSEPQDLTEAPRGEWVYELPGGEIGEGLVHQVYLPLAFVPGLGEVRNVVETNFGRYEDRIAFDGLGIQAVDSTGRRLITINVNTNAPNRNELLIQGTDGELRLDLLQQYVFDARTGTSRYVPLSRQFLFGNLQLTSELVQNLLGKAYDLGRRKWYERIGSERAYAHEGHYWLISEHLEAVRRDAAPPVPLEDARDTVRVYEAIDAESRVRSGSLPG
jgi:predicted dehydrogenase